MKTLIIFTIVLFSACYAYKAFFPNYTPHAQEAMRREAFIQQMIDERNKLSPE